MMLFISHLPIVVRKDPWVVPVGVGGIGLEGGISDRSTGLDAVNPRVCEWSGILTAATLLRNGRLRSASPWIGTCHYRRLLWLSWERHGSFARHFSRPSDDPMATCRELLDPSFVEDVLQDHEIIVPRTVHNDRSLADQYALDHNAEDWEVFVSIMVERYGASVRSFFQHSHAFTRCAMFAMATDRFLSFCDEARVVIEKLLAQLEPRDDPYQNRAAGFLMERFVTYSIHLMRLRAFQTPLVLIEPGQRW